MNKGGERIEYFYELFYFNLKINMFQTCFWGKIVMLLVSSCTLVYHTNVAPDTINLEFPWVLKVRLMLPRLTLLIHESFHGYCVIPAVVFLDPYCISSPRWLSLFQLPPMSCWTHDLLNLIRVLWKFDKGSIWASKSSSVFRLEVQPCFNCSIATIFLSLSLLFSSCPH